MKADARGATVGRPYQVEVTITNAGNKTIGGIRLQIDHRSIPVRFGLQKMEPTPTQEEADQWTSYIYPDLAPHDHHDIKMTLIPRQPGRFEIAVRLVSNGTDYDGVTKLPVRVAAPAPREMGGLTP